jgi:hypothetical protein
MANGQDQRASVLHPFFSLQFCTSSQGLYEGAVSQTITCFSRFVYIVSNKNPGLRPSHAKWMPWLGCPPKEAFINKGRIDSLGS